MFRLMDELRHRLPIRDFAISQPSLELVFIHFARNQVSSTT
jgi:hypothetical protein